MSKTNKPLLGRCQCQPAGFTLVEVTLAVAVGSFALLGLLAMAMMGLRMGRQAVDDSATAAIAQRIFTDLRKGTTPTLTYDNQGNPGGTTFYNCTCSTLTNSAFLRRVELMVTWPNINPPPNTNRFVTEIANLQPYN